MLLAEAFAGALVERVEGGPDAAEDGDAEERPGHVDQAQPVGVVEVVPVAGPALINHGAMSDRLSLRDDENDRDGERVRFGACVTGPDLLEFEVLLVRQALQAFLPGAAVVLVLADLLAAARLRLGEQRALLVALRELVAEAGGELLDVGGDAAGLGVAALVEAADEGLAPGVRPPLDRGFEAGPQRLEPLGEAGLDARGRGGALGEGAVEERAEASEVLPAAEPSPVGGPAAERAGPPRGGGRRPRRRGRTGRTRRPASSPAPGRRRRRR